MTQPRRKTRTERVVDGLRESKGNDEKMRSLSDVICFGRIQVIDCDGCVFGGELLQRAAKQCAPLMKKHGLYVESLCELHHSQGGAALLGYNEDSGREIRVKLRQAHNPKQFLEYESIVCTLLHELVHNTIGPHNAEFHKLLKSYKEEVEEMMSKGITSPDIAFMGIGRRLGTIDGRLIRQTDSPNREAIARAAGKAIGLPRDYVPEGRYGKGCNWSGRLGGNTCISRILSPREAAAAAAAQREMDQHCGTFE